jgi:hypothetical protein
MQCGRCQKPLSPAARFCGFCGAAVSTASGVPAASPVVDLLAAAAAFRRLVVLFALLWTLGAVGYAIRHSGAEQADPLAPLLFDCGLGLPLVALAVGMAIAAVRLATALALPSPRLWAGAWVPCLSVVALVMLGWALRVRLAERGLPFSLVFGAPSALESRLGRTVEPGKRRL